MEEVKKLENQLMFFAFSVVRYLLISVLLEFMIVNVITKLIDMDKDCQVMFGWREGGELFRIVSN